MKTMAIRPGGLDSVSLAHRVAAEHELVGLLFFDDANTALATPHLSLAKFPHGAHDAPHDPPFAKTWACCKGGGVRCGRCGTCVDRDEAFSLAGMPDSTIYADAEFWREAVQRGHG